MKWGRCCVLIALAATLAGCARSSLAREPHVLRIAFAGDPNSLVPFVAIDQDVIGLEAMFCQTLVGLDARNRVVPILVTRVPSRANGDISPDGTRITYHLRRNVRFADGLPFTSADVAFNYRAIFDPRNRVSSLESYRKIASLETPGPYTVVIRLREPWNAAVRVLFAQSDYPYGIVPAHVFKSTQVVGSAWEDAPFGTGPFRVSQWKRGDRLVLEPNPYFSPKPKLARIELQIVPNLNSNFIALQSGAVDVATLTPDTLAQAEKLSTIRVVRTPENGTGFLYLQTQAAPTNNIAVRRAIAYALDEGELASAWRNAYPQATSVFPPPVVSWNNPGVRPYPHDLRAARGELAKLGGDAVGGVIGVDAENPMAVRIATLVQSELNAAGMHFDVKTNPTRTWFSYEGLLRSGKATIVTETWVGGGDPEQSLNLRCVQAVPGSSNHSFYCSKQLDALFDDQSRTPSEAQRERDFNAIQDLVHTDVPVIPLYYEIFLEGVNARVTGFQRNMLRIPVNPENWDAR